MGLTNNKNTQATSLEAQGNARVIAFADKLKKQTESRLARENRLVCGIWGEPKTVKSGLALDFPNKQIYVLDWDDGCEPTWRQNHEMTDRITLWNPEVRNDNGELDIQKSETTFFDTFIKGYLWLLVYLPFITLLAGMILVYEFIRKGIVRGFEINSRLPQQPIQKSTTIGFLNFLRSIKILILSK